MSLNPEQLAKSGTEHAEQMALFAWANMAAKLGFEAANDMRAYSTGVRGAEPAFPFQPVPVLKWLHAIPNAGARGNKVAAAQLKAEGVKAGIADVFLPVKSFHVPRGFENRIHNRVSLSGLYIEMKRADGKLSDLSSDQYQFGNFVLEQGFAWRLCFGWHQAAITIQEYLTYSLIL
jgi:hypothetical protein